MPEHQVVNAEAWLAARKELLAREKEFSRLRDELGRRRRELPWEPVADFGVAFTAEEQERAGAYNYGSLTPHGADREGATVFATGPDGRVFHTYSTYSRGIDLLNTAYNYLDLVPQGRGEDDGRPQSWVRRHDEYEHAS
jgi:predicted dithiol-disulfide oxidoreductase (DUF899 family)